MSKKKKKRRLWLNVKASFKRCKRKPSRESFIEKLIASIEAGNYKLPACWDVQLFWKNGENKPWKSGEWQDEMSDSAESSDGFDIAVTSWLERKL